MKQGVKKLQFQTEMEARVCGLVLGNLRYRVRLNIFLWKASTDSLPIEANLLKRKIIADPSCHLCGSFPEDVNLALWDYEAVKIVWCKDFSWVNRFEAANGTFLDLMERLITKLGIADLFVTMAWLIWTHQKKKPITGKNHTVGKYCCGKLHHRRNWLPPELGEFKANFDGAMFNERDEAGVGVVIRDSMG